MCGTGWSHTHCGTVQLRMALNSPSSCFHLPSGVLSMTHACPVLGIKSRALRSLPSGVPSGSAVSVLFSDVFLLLLSVLDAASAIISSTTRPETEVHPPPPFLLPYLSLLYTQFTAACLSLFLVFLTRGAHLVSWEPSLVTSLEATPAVSKSTHT